MGTPWIDAAWAAYAASKRDEEAAALWNAMERWARYAHSRFFHRNCPDTALDIVALGWEKLELYNPQKGNFATWFGTLCFNELRRIYHRQRQELSLEAMRPIPYEPAWMHRSDLEQKLVELWQEGRTWEEMGQALGLRPETVKSHGLGQALKELK